MTHESTSSVDSLSRGAQRALYNFITILGDNKFRLGIRYAEYCNAAPTIEASIAAAAMAQDELGHTRNLFPLLREFHWARDEEEDGIARANYRCLSLLDRPFQTWADFVCATFLLDQAITTILTSAKESAFGALRQRARKMVEEERFHTIYGTGWFRSLAKGSAATRAELDTRSREWWDEVLCFFGPAGSTGLMVLRDEALLDEDSPQLRDRFLQSIRPALQEVGLELNAHELPWENWDLKAWRLKAQAL